MEKKINIKKIAIIMVVICLVVGFGIDYCLFKPSKINRYIASNVYKESANTDFVDNVFYQCVIDAYNEENKVRYPYTYSLNVDELNTIKTLTCNTYNGTITRTDGIEKINTLEKLDLTGHEITDIYLGSNQKLTTLILSNNILTSIDLSNNALLEDLVMFGNSLTNLDISKNIKLNYLDVSNNQLTGLNVKNNSHLNVLKMSSNPLSSLDLSESVNLTYLDVSNGILNDGDINLYGASALKELNISKNHLGNLDISSNLNLESLNVFGNGLSNLDISKNVKLTSLEASANQLTNLDLSRNESLTKLSVFSNKLTNLDLKNLSNLTEINANNNQLSSVNVSGISTLTNLNLSNNKLSSIDVSENLNLEYLNVSGNQLTSLDLSKNTKLSEIFIYENQYKKNIGAMFVGVVDIPNVSSVILPSHVTQTELDYYKTPSTGDYVEPKIEIMDNNKMRLLSSGSDYYNSFNEYFHYSESYLVEIVDINSSVYEIDKNSDSINVGNDTDVEVKNNIVVENGTIDIEGDYLVVKHEADEVKRFKLERIKNIEYSSDVYNLDNDYIYVGNDTDEEILSNIVSSLDGIVKEINNNVLIIKYNDEVIANYDLVRVTSEKYNLDNYGIFGIDGDYVKSNLNVINGTLEAVENDEDLLLYINVLYKGKVISNIPIHNILSDKYVITDEYIFTGFEEINISDITTSSYVVLEIVDSKLNIKYHNDIVGDIDLISLNKLSEFFGVNEKTNVISFKNGVTYQKFMDEYFELGNSNMSVRVVDQNNIEVESLENNYKFEVLYNSKLLKSYIIVFRDEDLIYTDAANVVTISHNEDILKNLRLNDNFTNVRSLFETSGNVFALSKYNSSISMDSKIKTGDYFVVEFSDYRRFIYLSVLGDVDGSGDVTNNDVSKAYNILRKKEEVEEVYYLATDTTKDDKLKINDIAKLHQYAKGKILSLED